MNKARDAFIHEMPTLLQQCNDLALGKFYHLTMDFVGDYATGYQLGGPIYLVLDNSIIQDFKHKESDPKRALRAHAYTAFCRFVTGWSDRKTHIAVSPVAVYEHLGRRAAPTGGAAWAAMSELHRLLYPTKMSCHSIRFSSPDELVAALRDIEFDAEFLTQYAKTIDTSDWKLDLKTPFGVKIPISIADAAIPNQLPLKYFDPWYVKFTFTSRIEQLIMEQSKDNPDAQPIGSGELTKELSDLNEFKRGVLTGLGDIDLLQICDVSRQYKQQTDYVLLGQTFDRGLNRVLRLRHVFHEARSMEGGHPNVGEQASEMVRFMFSNPFAKQDERLAIITPRIIDFIDAMTEACLQVQARR
ncbi:hypothetical protein [Paraburkholderia megapolitana]|uniref:hypothetical protein n=1 Tax=Paraburkholderia megapolitana TaxID=420953 RepID=UPI0038B6B2CB